MSLVIVVMANAYLALLSDQRASSFRFSHGSYREAGLSSRSGWLLWRLWREEGVIDT